MGIITKLPTEILDAIVTSTQGGEPVLSNRDLRALSPVCKHLHRIVEPLIYHTISWPKESFPTISRPHLLLRSLLHRPQLGTHFQHATIETWNKYTSAYFPSTCFSDAELQLALGALQSLGLPDPIMWMCSIQQGSLDAVVALLLALLPNIHTLALCVHVSETPSHLHALLAHLPTSRALFSNLQRAALSSDGQSPLQLRLHRPVALPPYAPLLALPSLQTFSIPLLQPPYAARRAWNVPFAAPPPSQLTSLALLHSFMAPELLAALLQAVPNLHTFRYDCILDNAFGDTVSPPLLLEALAPLAASLRHLSLPLTFTTSDVRFDYPTVTLARLGSLVPFTRLETLEASFVLLLGWEPEAAPRLDEVLPLRLRELWLRDDMASFVAYEYDATDHQRSVIDFVEERMRPQEGGLRLERLGLRLRESHIVGWEAKWEQSSVVQGLEAACEKAEVDFVFDMKI